MSCRFLSQMRVNLESLTCVFDCRNVNFSEPANELPFLIADASNEGLDKPAHPQNLVSSRIHKIGMYIVMQAN